MTECLTWADAGLSGAGLPLRSSLRILVDFWVRLRRISAALRRAGDFLGDLVAFCSFLTVYNNQNQRASLK
jgi:hypothetical protein